MLVWWIVLGSIFASSLFSSSPARPTPRPEAHAKEFLRACAALRGQALEAASRCDAAGVSRPHLAPAWGRGVRLRQLPESALRRLLAPNLPLLGPEEVVRLYQVEGSLVSNPLDFYFYQYFGDKNMEEPLGYLFVAGNDSIFQTDGGVDQIQKHSWFVHQACCGSGDAFFIQEFDPPRPLPSVYQSDIAYASCLLGEGMDVDTDPSLSSMCGLDDAPLARLLRVRLEAAERGDWDVFLHASVRLLKDWGAVSEGTCRGESDCVPFFAPFERLGVDPVRFALGLLWNRDMSDAALHWNSIENVLSVSLGRALAETRMWQVAARRLLEASADPNLDSLNRRMARQVLRDLLEWRECGRGAR